MTSADSTPFSNNYKYEVNFIVTSYNENPFKVGPNSMRTILVNGLLNGSIALDENSFGIKEIPLNYLYNIFCDTCPNIKFLGDFTLKEMINVTGSWHLGHKIRVVTVQK